MYMCTCAYVCACVCMCVYVRVQDAGPMHTAHDAGVHRRAGGEHIFCGGEHSYWRTHARLEFASFRPRVAFCAQVFPCFFFCFFLFFFYFFFLFSNVCSFCCFCVEKCCDAICLASQMECVLLL